MKKLIITLSLILVGGCLYAQNKDAEAEIRKLEQIEVQAVLQKDTVTLAKLWDKDYIVNAPTNKIAYSGTSSVDRNVLKMARTSFTRDVEKVVIRAGFAISMGSETVVPSGDQPSSGQTVKRRYTNIWEKQADGWKLVARHASIICQQN